MFHMLNSIEIYHSFFHNSFIFMISFKIKYDESVKIANKKISKRGGGGDLRRYVEICYFFFIDETDGYNTFLFQFSV